MRSHDHEYLLAKQSSRRPPQPDETRVLVERHALDTRHGVILRSDALAAGMSKAQVDRRVRRGHWIPGPVRGSCILAARAENPLARLTAATTGLGAIAWGRSALGLWDLSDHPIRPEVASPKQRQCATVSVLWVGGFDSLRTVHRRQIATVTLEVGLASVASSSDHRELNEIVDKALRRRLSTWPRIEQVWREFAGQGRPGSALLKQVIMDRSADLAVPLSQWSRDFAAKLVASGLPRPKMECRISDGDGRFIAQVDLAYPEHRYAIELDSLAYHLNSEAFEVDRRRDADLARRGWSVGRFTWQQYTKGWDQVIATIASQIGD